MVVWMVVQLVRRGHGALDRLHTAHPAMKATLKGGVGQLRLVRKLRKCR